MKPTGPSINRDSNLVRNVGEPAGMLGGRHMAIGPKTKLEIDSGG